MKRIVAIVLCAGFLILGVNVYAQQGGKGQISKIFGLLDEDGSGGLTEDEIKGAADLDEIPAQAKQILQKVVQSFDKTDADADGEISEDELTAAVSQLRKKGGGGGGGGA